MNKQEAIKYLEQHKYFDTCGQKSLEESNEAIDMAIEALSAERTGWIPVSERLPSEDGEYIVTMGKDGFDKGGNVTWAMFNKLKKGFYFPTDRVNYYIAVTAWQSLPKPYKGGDTE